MRSLLILLLSLVPSSSFLPPPPPFLRSLPSLSSSSAAGGDPDWKEALKALERAAALSPSLPDEGGEKEAGGGGATENEALKALERAAALSPSLPEEGGEKEAGGEGATERAEGGSLAEQAEPSDSSSSSSPSSSSSSSPSSSNPSPLSSLSSSLPASSSFPTSISSSPPTPGGDSNPLPTLIAAAVRPFLEAEMPKGLEFGPTVTVTLSIPSLSLHLPSSSSNSPSSPFNPLYDPDLLCSVLLPQILSDLPSRYSLSPLVLHSSATDPAAVSRLQTSSSLLPEGEFPLTHRLITDRYASTSSSPELPLPPSPSIAFLVSLQTPSDNYFLTQSLNFPPNTPVVHINPSTPLPPSIARRAASTQATHLGQTVDAADAFHITVLRLRSTTPSSENSNGTPVMLSRSAPSQFYRVHAANDGEIYEEAGTVRFGPFGERVVRDVVEVLKAAMGE